VLFVLCWELGGRSDYDRKFCREGKVPEKELPLMVGQASLRHSTAEGAGRPEAVEVEMEMEIIRAQRPMRQQSRQVESIRD
jgi:hypothetical protein